jgi:N-acetylglucosaminyldiphosphoundecaprenol N-acetyl-beta-D-mannosaminyltransferase
MSTLSITNRARQKVLGYPVDMVDEALALEVIESAWRDRKGLHIVTLNAEMVVAAQQDPELDRIIRHAHLIIPDGAGIVWAMRLQGIEVDRLPGIDLAAAALHRAAISGRGVALVGGDKGVLSRLEKFLPVQYPGLKIVYAQHGYFLPAEEERIAEAISLRKPELILVALGMQKQEYFIDRWQRAVLPAAVMIGVGGSFDVWGGVSKRAPQNMQKLHLEWLYRLIAEPWRWRRICSALPAFGFQVILDLLSRGKSEGKNGKKP